MSQGKLKIEEKYAIQGALSDGKSLDEIKEMLGRTTGKAVDNYVSGELDSILDTVVSARIKRMERGDLEAEILYVQEQVDAVKERSDSGNKVISSKELIQSKLEQKVLVPLDGEMIKEAMILLRGAGLQDDDAQDLLRRTHKKLNRPPVSSQELYVCCIGTLNAADHMVRKTASGKKGVAIMTPVAANVLNEVQDKIRDQVKGGVSRSARGNMYNPKTGEIS